ncbi:23S rRNA pseudouridine(2604) synthase RluF [Pseudoalteromonas shioyasakiensis]|jgi:23S rRNA pseudouridine2604 synthase|uniref:Pseudouridine synthase n=1 Tax=Pseudoalteromonas shioyasakiensis TaxID=1190813 RepID=A0ABT6TYW4_9GAMM|nr:MULTISPECIES: 23S rRNA pseudouridine(2604) synthase RluF [Pseudoalteromonas]MCO6355914.1 23S rRNA pseudouridine(2604) synthase RluF [Pseudoalteromonas shioyasakiensis]MDI4668802.1 23S rRNA pseudouridine(2604) synthase RluF [Pseudoalteromonas shioyasakiensis]MDI4673927.1 23S rRNA pseudouridine(2604) synthase RluF [Pseudoalteromonas shioyasakiensis]MDI4685524.1 23S rRNA pseudouridine(2604) synthase RluF [Pseudoalteromonas shioyasakiensis]MDI4704004.1 23S rRNA pseudouridine(2604) synthase RluF
MTELKRLNKFISETGFCSRREADKYIEEGRVTVNGSLPEMGVKVSEADDVLIDGKPLKAKPKLVYIAYNKPVGITCTTERKIQSNIVKAVNYPERIFPIGRLDRPSEGLIFLTNEGDIVNKILRAGNNHEKEYVVTVDKPLNRQFVNKMANGIPILDTVTKKCKVKQTGPQQFTIVLTQGLNRQIRRMCEYLGYEVVTLKRTRIMNVTLKGLKVGQWRHLTEQEMAEINNSIADSGKTEERSIDENKQPTQARAKQKPRNEEEKKRDFSKYVKKARSDAKQGQSRSKAGNSPSSKPNQTKRSSTKRTGTLSLKK